MISVLVLLLVRHSHGEALTMHDINLRLSSLENRIDHLESEVKILKSRERDSESKTELIEVQDDVSYLLMEQSKIKERFRAPQI